MSGEKIDIDSLTAELSSAEMKAPSTQGHRDFFIKEIREVIDLVWQERAKQKSRVVAKKFDEHIHKGEMIIKSVRDNPTRWTAGDLIRSLVEWGNEGVDLRKDYAS